MDSFEGRQTDPLSLHKYLYCGANPVNEIDPSGLSGSLTIVALGNDSSSFGIGGHAFLIWMKDGAAKATTYGTWGNNPRGRGDGLLEGEELVGYTDVPSDCTREKHIGDAAEENLMSLIQRYQDQGSDGWSNFRNCAYFAADAWMAATREDFLTLMKRDYLLNLPSPTKLKEEIQKANKNGYIAAKVSNSLIYRARYAYTAPNLGYSFTGLSIALP